VTWQRLFERASDYDVTMAQLQDRLAAEDEDE
jgi:hypothetical protein